jgi:hypothetical protein
MPRPNLVDRRAARHTGRGAPLQGQDLSMSVTDAEMPESEKV